MKFSLENYKKGVRDLSRRDPKLKNLIKRHKIDFEPKLKSSPFESLVRAITHQQLYGKAAETILGRDDAHFSARPFRYLAYR